MDEPNRDHLEACRPGSEDLRLAEMADLARALAGDAQARQIHERVAQWDDAIGAAVDQVNVPAGLAERILKRLAAAAPQPVGALLAPSVAAATAEVEPAEEPVRLAPEPSGWSRRHWAGVAAAALAASALVVAGGIYFSRASDLPIDLLAEQWQAQLGAEWHVGGPGPEGFAVPSAVRMMPVRWQQIDKFSTTPVVAYELEDPKVGKAMLYVARMTRQGIPSAPPQVASSITGGKAIASWQSGDRLYVLVVDDNPRAYRAFVRAAATPLA